MKKSDTIFNKNTFEEINLLVENYYWKHLNRQHQLNSTQIPIRNSALKKSLFVFKVLVFGSVSRGTATLMAYIQQNYKTNGEKGYI